LSTESASFTQTFKFKCEDILFYPYNFLPEHLKVGDSLGLHDVDGRIILKWDIVKQVVRIHKGFA
jgi:hypothetical protein